MVPLCPGPKRAPVERNGPGPLPPAPAELNQRLHISGHIDHSCATDCAQTNSPGFLCGHEFCYDPQLADLAGHVTLRQLDLFPELLTLVAVVRSQM
jgi:hypothetical protein